MNVDIKPPVSITPENLEHIGEAVAIGTATQPVVVGAAVSPMTTTNSPGLVPGAPAAPAPAPSPAPAPAPKPAPAPPASVHVTVDS